MTPPPPQHQLAAMRAEDDREPVELSMDQSPTNNVIAVSNEHDERLNDELPAKVTALASASARNLIRMVEALLFAAAEPLDEATISARLPEGADVPHLLEELQAVYASRGVNLVRVAGKWAFRTADDLSFLMHTEKLEERRLSRAALETLSIIAYHQPVTRADIEEIRGVSISKGTLDVLLETGWVKMRGRRRTPGRPVTYGTTDGFLEHFGLDQIGDLPGIDELKAAGLLSSAIPAGLAIPLPGDGDTLAPDEDPLEDEADELEALHDLPEDEQPGAGETQSGAVDEPDDTVAEVPGHNDNFTEMAAPEDDNSTVS